MARLGLGENSILLPLALIVGVVTGAAAVGFHELINLLRDLLYRHFPPEFLYGKGLWLLVLLPAAGGLLVEPPLPTRSREGHGVVDVMESVMRNRGVIKPGSAIEKISTKRNHDRQRRVGQRRRPDRANRRGHRVGGGGCCFRCEACSRC